MRLRPAAAQGLYLLPHYPGAAGFTAVVIVTRPSSTPTAIPATSRHSRSFPALLHRLGASLAVSTYQAGKLVLLRAVGHQGDEGAELHADYHDFARPMGVAVQGIQLAVGSHLEIEEYRNQAEVAARLEPLGRADSCYMPAQSTTTGDIEIHEMAYAGDQQLWFVNTRFSALCTLEAPYSFVPRWRPPFVTAWAGEDRCHLNGLAMVAGRPRYVTALGSGDGALGG